MNICHCSRHAVHLVPSLISILSTYDKYECSLVTKPQGFSFEVKSSLKCNKLFNKATHISVKNLTLHESPPYNNTFLLASPENTAHKHRIDKINSSRDTLNVPAAHKSFFLSVFTKPYTSSIYIIIFFNSIHSKHFISFHKLLRMKYSLFFSSSFVAIFMLFLFRSIVRSCDIR